MNNSEITELSWDDFDEMRDPRDENNDFDLIVENTIRRRGFLCGTLAFGSGAAVFGSGLFTPISANNIQTGFEFEPIDIATDFDVHVPNGYQWKTLVRYGDPLFKKGDGAYSEDGLVASESAEFVFGENTDGMETFDVDGKTILTINSEYANPKINLPEASEGLAQTEDEANM